MHSNITKKVKLPQIGKLSSTSDITRSRGNSSHFSSATVLNRRLHTQKTADSLRGAQQGLKLIDLTDALEVFDLVKKSPDSIMNDS